MFYMQAALMQQRKWNELNGNGAARVYKNVRIFNQIALGLGDTKDASSNVNRSHKTAPGTGE